MFITLLFLLNLMIYSDENQMNDFEFYFLSYLSINYFVNLAYYYLYIIYQKYYTNENKNIS